MKKLKWFSLIFFILCLLWILLMNNTLISLDYGFGTVRASLIITILISYLLGALSSAIPLSIFCIRFMRKKKPDDSSA
ncbi:hypothetical protein LSG31_08230 [Fodinisporobacter ferrooxydans]|uniref:DUF1049 domain-containing protein n=1 Tax=Fodinisporobacter ferrooxydans TaxID=2901836 RepID=A0ABY4CNU4_9BACL|nr:hypothetical protein LSG31_08230 [Alicyclobacillaceae bacterium MYW30-H2]